MIVPLESSTPSLKSSWLVRNRSDFVVTIERGTKETEILISPQIRCKDVFYFEELVVKTLHSANLGNCRVEVKIYEDLDSKELLYAIIELVKHSYEPNISIDIENGYLTVRKNSNLVVSILHRRP